MLKNELDFSVTWQNNQMNKSKALLTIFYVDSFLLWFRSRLEILSQTSLPSPPKEKHFSSLSKNKVHIYTQRPNPSQTLIPKNQGLIQINSYLNSISTNDKRPLQYSKSPIF